jgi:mannose-6-phosphate isomerase-like protein (cupin superfamily)
MDSLVPPDGISSARLMVEDNTAATIKAFKRTPSIGISTWYKGILISNLATEQDTNGAFELVVTRMRKGTEPPPHVHEREHEMFYVLEGVLDVYVGDAHLQATAGECVFLPKRKPHVFRIQSPEIHMLVLMTPGGFMNASAGMAIPAQTLNIPPDDGVTYATVDLGETIRVFGEYGVRFLAPDEIARELPCFPLAGPLSHAADDAPGR